MDNWYNVPFFWGLVFFGGLAILLGLRAWMLSNNLEREAREEWAYQVSENMQDLRLTEDAFVRAYTRVHAPRGWKLMAMALATLTLLAIPAFALIQMLFYKVWQDNLNEVSKMPQFRGRLAVLSDPVLVWQFCIFLSVIAFAVLVIGLFVRQYYKGSPGLMRDALIYERAGFMPETRLTVGPNPAHIDANLYIADEYDEDRPGTLRETYEEIFQNALGLEKWTEEDWQGSGQICDIYSDGSDMKIHVHTAVDRSGFDETSHPFFFPGEFARHDDKPKQYTIISLLPDAFAAFEKIKATGISMNNVSGSRTSRKCSFVSENMNVYIYDKRG